LNDQNRDAMPLPLKSWIFTLICTGISLTAWAQPGHRSLRDGDKAYKSEDFPAAQSSYQEALEARNSAQGNYNLGNTYFQQGNYEEAVKRFEEAAQLATGKGARASAYHNLGNAYFQQKNYEKSVEAYKNALRQYPNDLETKFNLAKAQRMIQVQPPTPQDQNSQDQDNQNKKDQPSPKQDESNARQDQQNPKNSKPLNDNRQKESEQQIQPGEMNREEAERLLEIVSQEEKKTMEKMQRSRADACGSEKEW
jgi:Ca-activated chloride channel homolog